MCVRKTLMLIFPALFIGALTVWLNNSPKGWLCTCLVFITLYSIITVWIYRTKITHMAKIYFYSILKKPLIESHPGLCGRENIVKEIYEAYCSTKRVDAILICGLGGSGKTTISKFFNSVLLNTPRNIIFSGRLERVPIHNNTIIFADYAYENLHEIEDFIQELKDRRKRRVLVVLLERTYAREHLSNIHYNYVIDLNSPQYILSEELLKEIIAYNVSHVFSMQKKTYDETDKQIDDHLSLQFAKQISSKIDPQYHRPIFAVIIAELYRGNESIDLSNTVSVNLLLKKYWAQKTRYSTMQSLIKATKDEFWAEKDRITEAINNAKQFVELLTLFCAMSRLKIDFKNHNCVELYSEDRLVKDENLTKYLQKYFNEMIDDDIKKHMVVKILGIDILTTYENRNYSHLIIEPNQFDIVSAWLLGKFYEEDEEYTRQLGTIISSVSVASIEKAIFSFVLRAMDEDTSNIFTWYINLKDCFISYEFWDFNEKIKELLAKLNLANSNNQYQIGQTVHDFLLSFIDTISEHISDADKLDLLQYQLKAEKENPKLEPNTKEVIDELIQKIEKEINRKD